MHRWTVYKTRCINNQYLFNEVNIFLNWFWFVLKCYITYITSRAQTRILVPRWQESPWVLNRPLPLASVNMTLKGLTVTWGEYYCVSPSKPCNMCIIMIRNHVIFVSFKTLLYCIYTISFLRKILRKFTFVCMSIK